jgi:hypothetical protein
MNLINTTRSRWPTKSYKNMAYRICPESAVIATQEDMGAMEDVFGLVYPDLRYRPTFRIGLLQHGVWEPPVQQRPGSVNREDLEAVLLRRRLVTAAFTAVWSGLGSFLIGSALLRGNKEMLEILQRRSKNTDYLVDTLKRVPEFQTRVVDQNGSLRRPLVKMIPSTVIGPLCALNECSIQDVFTSTDSKQIGLNLVKKTWLVIRKDCGKRLSLEEVAGWVQSEIVWWTANGPNSGLHPILDQVLGGRESDVGPLNGWIVERGMPVETSRGPTHRVVIEFVEQKTEQQRKLIEVEEEAARKK